MNRLARETSPYLLQHAHNPVDWWPWGPEAFAEARRRNVPIFLSIGYSTCYWCHVMERESFESAAIARQMNDLFVNIKVDREERPDVDDIYMAATQILSGRGGWPMSAFLEPRSLRPFWCGTYFPPEPKMGMPGFPQILEALSNAWLQRPAEVTEQAESVAAAVREQLALAQTPVGLSLDQVSQAAASLLRMLDRINGGFGGAPKFPQPVFLELLLDVRENAGDEATRSAIDHAVRLTLDRMSLGGMNDQVGGGFHRYSVDEHWLVPHFEKMLYDNAQLAGLYARAASIYTDDSYRRTAERTLNYVLAEMTGPQGEFFSAQDAEVNGREGANYIWTEDQLRAALPPDDAAFAAKVYGVDEGPNFRDPHHPQDGAASVLYLKSRPDAATLERLDRINPILYAARAKRPQPRLDDKTITAWNGMMIAAFARAAVWLNQPEYAKAASRAADFILAKLITRDGHLLRTYRAAQAKTDAFLEDHAFLIEGLLALVAAQGRALLPRDTDYGVHATRLAAAADALFADTASGGYFDTREGGGDLFVRPRSSHDGAIPGAASTMLHGLIALYDLTGEAAQCRRALDCLKSLSSAIAQSPVAAANATRALLRLATSSRAVAEQIAALGPAPAAEAVGEPQDTPVEIFADTERVEVGTDHPAQFKLVLRIREGYHLNAADPGDENLIPLRVGITGGTGLIAYADYPPGEPYGPDGAARVYKGSVEFNIALERGGEWSGRPILTVRFQACTDTECLPPMTAELDVAIDPLD